MSGTEGSQGGACAKKGKAHCVGWGKPGVDETSSSSGARHSHRWTQGRKAPAHQSSKGTAKRNQLSTIPEWEGLDGPLVCHWLPGEAAGLCSGKWVNAIQSEESPQESWQVNGAGE